MSLSGDFPSPCLLGATLPPLPSSLPLLLTAQSQRSIGCYHALSHAVVLASTKWRGYGTREAQERGRRNFIAWRESRGSPEGPGRGDKAVRRLGGDQVDKEHDTALLPSGRESMLFIGTQFSNLYTAVDTPAKGRVGVCVVFVFACKYVLGHSRVSQPPNSGYASSGTLAFSLRRMPPRPATDDALTHTGSSAALRPAPLPSHGPIPFTFPPRPDLHYVHLR
jgi:hypothetical protein